jgi:putative FmdB family regulatory protein
MPTYDYICENCEYEFEQFQAITARSIRKCPRCGKMSLKRLVGSGSGVIFKGAGFYQTDYRSEGYKKAQKSEKADTQVTAESGNKKKDEAAGGGKPAAAAKTPTSSVAKTEKKET